MFLPVVRTDGVSTSDYIARVISEYDTFLRRNLERGYTRQDLGITYLYVGVYCCSTVNLYVGVYCYSTVINLYVGVYCYSTTILLFHNNIVIPQHCYSTTILLFHNIVIPQTFMWCELLLHDVHYYVLMYILMFY